MKETATYNIRDSLSAQTGDVISGPVVEKHTVREDDGTVLAFQVSFLRPKVILARLEVGSCPCDADLGPPAGPLVVDVALAARRLVPAAGDVPTLGDRLEPDGAGQVDEAAAPRLDIRASGPAPRAVAVRVSDHVDGGRGCRESEDACEEMHFQGLLRGRRGVN